MLSAEDPEQTNVKYAAFVSVSVLKYRLALSFFSLLQASPLFLSQLAILQSFIRQFWLLAFTNNSFSVVATRIIEAQTNYGLNVLSIQMLR